MPFISQLSTAYKNAAHRDGHFTLFNGAHRHFNLWAPGGTWEKGAGPCAREEAERRAHDPGHSWYGQRLWRAETWKALNVLIQSSAAVQTKRWMRDCWREGIVPLLQMHDSLDLSVASPEVPEMVARLGVEVIKLEVPMMVDVKYGRTWADATHTWAEVHAETSPHIELTVDLPDDRARTQREDAKAPAGGVTNTPWEGNSVFANPPPCMAEEGILQAQAADPSSPQQSPPPPPSPPPGGPSGNGRGDGFDSFTTETDRRESSRQQASEQRNGKWSDYRNTESKQQTSKPYAPVRDALCARGYRMTRTFPFSVPGATEPLFCEDRFELPPGITPSKERP